MARGLFLQCVIVFSMVLVQIQAISSVEPNVQNTITEEERRGGDNTHSDKDNANNAKKNGKILVDDNTGDKKTRGIHSIHSPSASYKHQQYFVPSAYDSHIAATGHGGGGGGGVGGGQYSVGSTSGYDYVGHGGTAPTSSGAGGHIGHIQHQGPTASATGFGGYGLAHIGHGYGGGHGGFGGHSGQGGHSGHGGQGPVGHGGLGGYGPHGHSAHGHGHELYGGGQGGGQGGFHNALALKGLLIPLAGIALLGAAAALSTNPVLLQLGVVNGRRRRRSVSSAQEASGKVYPANPHVQPESNY